MERIKNIINSKGIGNVFFNLYDRWLDESEYEDINEYGKVITDAISKEYPTYNVKLMASTKRPFGVKIGIGGDINVHIFIKIKGRYAVLSAKRI